MFEKNITSLNDFEIHLSCKFLHHLKISSLFSFKYVYICFKKSTKYFFLQKFSSYMTHINCQLYLQLIYFSTIVAHNLIIILTSDEAFDI